ncbi:MAG: hypothetical protein ACREEM_33750 [Blastocatellia bacterium]
MRILLLGLVIVLGGALCFSPADPVAAGAQSKAARKHFYFPPPGEELDKQQQVRPEQAGLNPAVIEQLKGKAARWALWRHGYLVHVEGDFNQAVHVASLRKTWHALTVGAAIKQGRIPSLDQKINAAGRGKGWETPALWPLNAAEYQRMERVLDDLARRRLIVFPFAGFLGRASNFPRDPKEQELYLRSTLARLGAYWNVLLNVGGPEPELKNNTYMTREEINRAGALIRRLDLFGHLLTVHTPTGDNRFGDEPWLSYVTLQGPKTFDRRELSAGLLRNHAGKPLYAQETLWSGNYTVTRRHGRDYTDDDIRKNAYVITMSAAALNFADNRGDSSTGFSGTLRPEDRAEARHDIIKRVWDFLETVPFYRMSPRQDLVTNGFCLAEEGREYLVYLETGGPVSVKVKPAHPRGYAVRWINARETKEARDGGATTTGENLQAPDGDDWLLRLMLISR